MQNETRELDLIAQARTGDRAALSQLLLVYYDSLHRFATAKISPQLQGLVKADDVLQQTFVRAAQAIESFEPRHPGALRAWLKTITANLIRDAEKRRRRERRAARWDQNSGRSSRRGLAQAAACDGTSPSGRASRGESLRRIRVALASLPPDQRDVIQQYYLTGRSLDEIAQSMGRSKDAVRGICYRGRKNLRAIIGGSSLFFSG